MQRLSALRSLGSRVPWKAPGFFVLGFLCGAAFVSVMILAIWTAKQCWPDRFRGLLSERKQDRTVSSPEQADAGLASIDQLVVEETVRRLMFVNGPRGWLELCSTCQVFRQFPGNLNNYVVRGQVVDAQALPSRASHRILAVLDFTRVRLRLDELWGDARYDMWAQMQRASTPMSGFARQQIASSSSIRQVTGPRVSPSRNSGEAPRPDYGVILRSENPRSNQIGCHTWIAGRPSSKGRVLMKCRLTWQGKKHSIITG